MWQIDENSIVKTEGAVTEPVTLDEIKTWIRGLDGVADFDELLVGIGKGARQTIEDYCVISIVPKTISLDVTITGDEWERVPMPYTSGLTGVVVKELDYQDVETTLTSGTDYYVRGTNIRLSAGRYSISYTTIPGTIPEALKEAIKAEAAARFNNSGENVEGIGLSLLALQKARPYQNIWL